MKTKTKLIIWVFSGFIILGLIGIYAYTQVYRGTGTIKIATTPEDTTYTLGGISYTGGQEVKLKSGKYEVTFHRNLFLDKTENVSIIKNSSISLEVNLEVDESAVNNAVGLSESDSSLIDASQQTAGTAIKDKFIADFPIVSDLPIITDSFRIDYGLYGQKTEPTIEITIFTEALSVSSEATIRETALQSIKKYNIDAKKIVWYKDSKKNFE